MRKYRSAQWVVALLCLGLLLVACGGGGGATATTAATSTVRAQVPAAETGTTGPSSPESTATTAPTQVAQVPTTTPAPEPTGAMDPTEEPSPTNTVEPEPTGAPEPTTEPNQEPTAEPKATDEPEEPSGTGGPVVDVLRRATQQQLKQKSYRATQTTVNLASDEKITSSVEYLAPDRYRVIQNVPGRQKREIILVGNKGYIREGNGEWQQAPFDIGALVKAFRDPAALNQLLKGVKNGKQVGQERVNGVQTRVYTYDSTFDNPSGEDIRSKNRIWIGAKDGLPYKSESEGEFANVKSKTTSIYDYKAEIKIEAPIK